MNITTLTKAIEVLANSATAAIDILTLSKVLERLKLGNVTAVATYNDMITLTKQAGDLVFVDGEQKLYFKPSAYSVWRPIVDTANLGFSWGSNNNGRLGDGAISNRSSPVSVVGGFTDWVHISAGSVHSAGLRSNGTAWAWGSNNSGRLGDGTTTYRSSPVSVVGGFTDWVQVSAGGNHTAALRSNGTVWTWGNGGVMGDGTTTNKSSPVSVVGGFTDWVQVSAGFGHTIGLRSNGTAWAWGGNNKGRLGDGTITTRSSPVSVVGGFTDWVQVSAGTDHTAALRSNGTAWTWGYNISGQLGDNTVTDRSSPVSVVGGFTDWVQVAAGGNHTVGLRANGTAWAWGRNIYGQLGDNTSNNAKSSPVSVVGGFTNWVQVSAGALHTTAIRANGTAWAWGRGNYGQLGNGNVSGTVVSPVLVVGGFTDWVHISAGELHTTAVR